MKNEKILTIVMSIGATIILIVVLRSLFFKKKDTQSNWKPEYADPNKLKRSMMGMASEGNSVAGMIANPKYGAMVHS